jgi:hypothetical protein
MNSAKLTKIVAYPAWIAFFIASVDAANDQSDQTGAPSVYDVRAYGATGDGTTNDGVAIQKAIDACTKDGGGVVLLNNGTFVSGGIVLKSNVELHLTSSATLLAFTDITKYNQDDKFHFRSTICSFIYAYDATHIAITGAGKIDGRGKSFTNHEVYSERPQLIVLRQCKDVHIDDIFLTNSGMFTLWLIQCERIRIGGIRILALGSPNNDGIDIDGCKDVFIANSNIHTVDDCIGVKSSDKNYASTGLVITNCILSSRCAAIRFGPDSLADTENITVSNCVIRDTGLNGIKIQEALGGTMRNMTFSNIVMDNVKGPISIRCSGWHMGPYIGLWQTFDDTNWENGKLQNILFDNIRATVPRTIMMKPEPEGSPVEWLNLTKLNLGISITGTAKTRPEQITFSNIDITFAGGGTALQGARRNVPDLEKDYPEMYMFGELPAYGLYMHHVSGVVLNNVQFRLANEDLRPAIVGDDVDDMELSGFKAEGSKRAESMIRLENSRNVLINNSRPLNRIGTFLRLEGAKSEVVRLAGNRDDLSDRMWESAEGTKAKAVLVDR